MSERVLRPTRDGPSISLSPVLIHFFAPHGKLYRKLQHVLAQLTTPLLPIRQQHPGPKKPKHGIPPIEWPTVMHRVLENHEPLRKVANDYGVSYFSLPYLSDTSLGRRFLLWQIHCSLGRLYQRLRNVDRSQHEFAAAQRVIESLAATMNDAYLRENFLCAALAFLPKKKTILTHFDEARKFDGLSAREREIAVLIAQGKSNREIANMLVVSERTVETHVSNILAKLNFTSRAQIAVWAVKIGLANEGK